MTQLTSPYPFSIITVMLIMAKHIISAHFSNNSHFNILWNNDEQKNKNESYYVNFQDLDLGDHDCKVLTTNNLQRVDTFSSSNLSVFSPLVPVNKSLSGVNITYDDSDMVFIDYKLLKYSFDKAYEISIYLNKTSRTTKIDYCEIALDLPSIQCLPFLTNKSIEQTLKIHLEKHVSLLYEVCLEIKNKVTTLYFKVGEFNTTNAVLFRKKKLTTLDDSNDSEYIKTIQDMRLVSLGSFDGQNRQFILYQKNKTKIYLIKSLGGVMKDSNIVIEELTLKFPVNRVVHAEGQFLILDTNITMTDLKNKQIPTRMNYYISHNLGNELKASHILNIKNLSQGVFLNSFTSKDRTQIMLDFILPDLDGYPDETLLSSLYYSKAEDIFAVFLEEFTVNKNGSYADGSYRRFFTKDYMIELYRKMIDEKTEADHFTVSVSIRETGKELGEIRLPQNKTIIHTKYFETENLLFLKFATNHSEKEEKKDNIMFLAIQDSFLLYHLKVASSLKNLPAPLNPNSKRIMQIINDMAIVRLSVECRNSFKDANYTFPKSLFNFSLVEESGDYFSALEKNPTNNSEEIKATYNKLVSTRDIEGIFPAGIELNLNTSTFVKGSFLDISMIDSKGNLQTNHHFRKEFFRVKLDNLALNKPIYFETKRGRKIERSLIFDHSKNTSYLKLENGIFVWKKNALDNREVYSVEMLNQSSAIINISKNIFSLDVETLKEQPLIGVGSFCLGAKNVKFSGINHLLMCMTSSGFTAQYSHDRFTISQTKIKIVQPDTQDILKKNSFKWMLYSNSFPSTIFALTTSKNKMNPKSYGIFAVEFFATTDIIMQKAGEFELVQLKNFLVAEEDDLDYAALIADHIIFTTVKNRIHLYHLRIGFSPGNKYLFTYLRSFNLNDHFKKHVFEGFTREFKLSVKNYQKIEMHETSYSKGEKARFEKLCFQVVIEYEESNKKKVLNNVVIFDHFLSQYEAFSTLFRSNQCVRLYLGPAFLNDGEIQERSLSVICIEDASINELDSNKPIFAKLLILQNFKNTVELSDDTKIEEIINQASEKTLKEKTNLKTFSMTFTKTAFTPDLEKFQQDKEKISKLKLEMKVRVKFYETFQKFSVKEAIPANLLSYAVENKNTFTFFGLLRNKVQTRLTLPLFNYFNGHIFNSSIECESYIECRDKVINGTGQLTYSKVVARYPEFVLHSMYHFGITTFKDSGVQMNYLITNKRIAIHSSESVRENIEIGNLLSNCSEPSSYENYLISFCSYHSDQNYFKVIDLNDRMNYFEINITMPTGRVLKAVDVTVSIKENYLVLYTFNNFIGRYLTVFLFKLTPTVQYESHGRAIFFSNPLIDKLGIIYFGENPMNDESVSFKIYRDNASILKQPTHDMLANSVDKLYIWSLRRITSSKFDIRIEGLKLDPQFNPATKKTFYNVSLLCDDKRMEIRFDLLNQPSSSYLLDNAKMILMNNEDPEYYDMIIHLPLSQDYLVRIKSADLENNALKRLNMTTHAKILVISNPFFGIRNSGRMRPIFFNSTYFVFTNYASQKSAIRCYYIDLKIKNLAKQPTSDSLFTFQIIGDSTGEERGTIKEKGLDSIFTFSLIQFVDQPIATAFTRDLFLLEGDYFTNTTEYGRFL